MQYSNRQLVPPPAVFTGSIADANRANLKAIFGFDREKRSQSSAPRTFLSLEESNVHNALVKLFHGKCAFCETKTETKPHRFRPMTEALPIAATDINSHLYYSWLADAWQNIYPICVNCARLDPQQVGYFPVAGRRCSLPEEEELSEFVSDSTGLWPKHPPLENALLIDPCDKRDFHPHFHITLDGSLVGKSRAGKETIRYFSLNRPELALKRSALFKDMIGHLHRYLTPEPSSEVDQIVDFPEFEFGGTWYLLLRRLCAVIGWAAGPNPPLSMARIHLFVKRLKKRSDPLHSLQSALETIADEDREGAEIAPEISQGRSGKARLRKIALRNFKAFESLEFDIPEANGQSDGLQEMAPSLLILGENAAGKSSILEAIALALASDEARGELALSASDYILNPAYMGASGFAPPEEASVELGFADGATHLLDINYGGFNIQSRIEQEILPPVFAYGAFRHYLRKQRNYTAAKHIKNLLRSDEIISNPERWLLSLDEATFAQVVRQLRHVLTIEGEFEVIRRMPSEARCYIVTAFPGQNGNVQFSFTPLEAASSGFRTVLATVCDIFQGLLDSRVSGGIATLANASAVVLIDEVEAHLHPRWKMGIMRGLRLALPNVTFIATTHDPLCLRGMGDREVMVIQRAARSSAGLEAADQLPFFVERIAELPPTSALTVEQLLTSDFFQLYTTDSPQIEGKFAEISDILAKNRDLLTDDERKTLDAFDRDIESAMPVGLTEVHRLVQEAVAEFLKQRRSASEERLLSLRRESKDAIIRILGGSGG